MVGSIRPRSMRQIVVYDTSARNDSARCDRPASRRASRIRTAASFTSVSINANRAEANGDVGRLGPSTVLTTFSVNGSDVDRPRGCCQIREPWYRGGTVHDALVSPAVESGLVLLRPMLLSEAPKASRWTGLLRGPPRRSPRPPVQVPHERCRPGDRSRRRGSEIGSSLN